MRLRRTNKTRTAGENSQPKAIAIPKQVLHVTCNNHEVALILWRLSGLVLHKYAMLAPHRAHEHTWRATAGENSRPPAQTSSNISVLNRRAARAPRPAATEVVWYCFTWPAFLQGAPASSLSLLARSSKPSINFQGLHLGGILRFTPQSPPDMFCIPGQLMQWPTL